MNHMVPVSSEANPTDAELRRHFSEDTLSLGRDYAARGRVLRLAVTEDGRRIAAETQGTRASPYAQSIVLSRGADGRLRVSGLCSCPMRTNCKHVAAVLLEARGRHRLLAPAEALRPGPPALPERPASPAIAPLAAPRIARVPASMPTAPPPLPASMPAAPTPVPATMPAAPQAAPPPSLPVVARNAAPLPNDVQAWLHGLEHAGRTGTEDYPPDMRHRLLYVLTLTPHPIGPASLHIRPMTATVLKNGSLSAVAHPFAASRASRGAMPSYARPSDRLILMRLGGADYLRPDPEPEDTLRRIIATGRARWGTMSGPEVREAAPRPARLRWEMQQNGAQSPVLELPAPARAMLVPAPWFIEPETGLAGPLQLDVPAGVATHLLRAPPVPPEHADQVRAELTRRLPRLALPAPVPPERAEPLQDPLRPHLRLFAERIARSNDWSRGGGSPDPMPLARIRFGYGPFRLEPGEQRSIMAHDRRLYRLQRSERAEAAVLKRLRGLGFMSVALGIGTWQASQRHGDLMLGSEEAWLHFVLHELPKLRAEGWDVEVADDFPYRIAETEGDWTAELHEGSGIDWLELHLGVMIDGQRLDLVPSLLMMIAGTEHAGIDMAELLDEHDDDKPFLVPLNDGRLLSVPLGRVRPILLALWELFTGGAEGARFTRLDAAGLAGLEDLPGVVWQGGESVRALGRMLREAGGRIPNAVLPESFRGSLRPYQAQGVDWLQFLRAAELGGILADDMGLGKTVQTLAHLLIEQEAGRLTKPALIVCPTSLVPNWTLEAERFAPALKLLPLHGPSRKERFGEIAQHDLVLTTYPLLTRDHDVLTAQDWHIVVLDEAQTIKNPNAETTRQALRLKAGQRLCLSGTPLQNHLGELWSLFDFLAPGFLGSMRNFRTRFRTPIEKHADPHRQALLSKRVKPFLLRRTKDEVAVELPPKTEITEPVEMENAQRGVYEAIRLAMHARVQAAIAEKGLARSGIIILDALLKLRQACCDPRLLKLDAVRKTKAGSAKLERLMELLTVMLAEGRRVLLFSQFTEMLALIQDRLHDAGIEYVLLTGDTVDRATPVRRFQAGEVPLFLISLKAGGVGLNLTAADTVIHYDPWWNPAVEDQATDRAHRIGQDKRVFVHRLVTLGTIEEKMELLKEKKRALVASVLEAERGGALKLTEADVEELFSAE